VAGVFPDADSARTAQYMLLKARGVASAEITQQYPPLNGVQIPDHTVDFMRHVHRNSVYRSEYNEVVEASRYGPVTKHAEPAAFKVSIIKELRDTTQCSLKEAKDWAEANIFNGS
jgi:hypothetical protein